MKRTFQFLGLLGATIGAFLLSAPGSARACGCFTPPNPSVPVVQAGERIAFAVSNSTVTAHIQIQYAGAAPEFGWILPLPAPPTLELGSDELFAQLIAQTQPKYRLNAGNSCSNGSKGLFGAAAGGSPEADGQNGPSSPLVVQDSIGPYDYAVLKADSKDAMLQWLKDNRYFVPVGTDAAVVPYIHPGAYFLALKLRSGKSAGDIQPVVVHYASDLPMIPIVLTSVAAQPDMGIQVWMLGAGRAIPRNYYHTVINEAVIDWVNAGSNYNDVIIRATKEADRRHTFVTEYAGASSMMRGVLDPPGRFGDANVLKQIKDPVAYVQYLISNRFFPQSAQQGGSGPPARTTLSGLLLSILTAYIPMPRSVVNQGFEPGEYFQNLDYWLNTYRPQHPQEFADLDFNYDPVKLTDEIWDRVVKPTLGAAQLFTTYPYLTRLYTTLSPEQMDSDPVFSYNPGLPDVSNVHQATLYYQCSWLGDIEGATIRTDSGFAIDLPDTRTPRVAPASLPASERIEMLREMGAPEVVTDNRSRILAALDTGSGCSLHRGPASSTRGLAALALFGLLGLVALRRRRG